MARGRAGRFVDVGPEERGDVALLFGVFFLLAFGYVVGQAAGFSLFVARFGADDLPFAFLTMPVFGVLVGWLNLRGAGRLTIDRLLLLTVAVMVGTSLLLRLGVVGEGAGWVAFLLPAWDAGVNSLNNLVVWGAVARLFDVGQAKRLGPVVSAGRSLALVCGGSLVPVIVSVVGTTDLYAVQAGCFVLAAGVLAVLVARHRGLLRGARVPGAAFAVPAGGPAPGYVRSVFLVVFLSMLAYVLVRNVFLDRGAARFPEPADYAGSIGLLNAVQGLLTLGGGLFVTGRFLGRFGVRSGLLAFPAALLVVYLPLAAADFTGDVQFVLASVGFVACGALLYSVRTPSVQLLYQPLDPAVRSAAVARAEGVVEPFALGCAGLALLGVTRVADLGARGMAAVVAVAGALLVVAAVRAFAGYRAALAEVLSRRWLRRGSFDLADLSTRAALVERVTHGDAEESVVAIGLLEDGGHDTTDLLVSLLGSDRPGVRADASARLLDRRDAVPVSALVAAFDRETDPELRAAAMRLAARQGPSDTVLRALDDRDPEIRRSALCGLLESGDGGAPVAAPRLRALAQSADPADRRVAAAAVAAAGGSAPVALVSELLAATDPEVVRAALTAAGRAGDPQLLPAVVAALADPACVRDAARASGGFGAAALDPLVAALAAPAAVTSPHHLVRAIGRIDGERSGRVLVDLLAAPDARVREHAALALVRRGRRLGADVVAAATLREAELVAARLGALVALEGDAGAAPRERGASGLLLEASLWDAVRRGRDQLLRLVTLLDGAPPAGDLERAVASADPRRRAYAAEVVETTVPQPMRSWVAPLATLDATAGALLERLPGDLRLGRVPDRADALAGLAAGADVWLAGLARAELARITDDHEGGGMISIIDRVMLLRSVDLFAGLPAEAVGDLAAVTDEVHVAVGQTLFHQGEVGASMYVVAEGRVRILVDGRVVDERGPRSVLGELALLDDEPRSASAVAVEPTLLLRIDQAPFFELLTDRPEVLHRMMRSVVVTLRSRLADVADLQRRVGPAAEDDRESGEGTGTV